MKKNFKLYIICWAILLIAFNVVCFITPSEVAGISKFTGSFWAGYVFITLAFIGQIVCAYFAFKADSLKKLFYNLPLISVSYMGLVITVIFGALFMAIPSLPYWAGNIVCFLILAFNAIAVIMSKAASEIVSDVDDKVDTKTLFIKIATENAQNIMNRAGSEATKAECKKVYEALRYSDPMSDDSLSSEEEKIAEKLSELSKAVNEDNSSEISRIADEIVLLAKDRNNKCKSDK